MTLAMVNVLPLPVTPRSVWCLWPPRRPSTSLSTAWGRGWGMSEGARVLREHERITREVLKANGGTEVKTMGDGCMASFGSVTRAVECAIALQRAFAERNASFPAHPEALEGRAEEKPPAHGSRASG